ncbi:metalloregulator ArsR/SmtB family transcription factor [Tateyamaria sp. ANG-S1]|uniref:ArsR/SmtB family transcription factor n=1 Tax=Tateyamaria sp. ANG-S1 TaxID=1577905 RepID=UPI00057F90D8|nr:metalloregulator ArsR/SmtB family transcription factor [Tateyamaria sp. ANG-S1]KIC51388.1 ArsR family transcriptional regulator [Tateyamaria sp. ANG-S1]
MTNQIDRFFSALSDPTRRAVVEQLIDGPAAVSALHDGHAMALPTFMKHLKVMEDSGLVTSTKKGRVRTYQMRQDALRAGADWLNAHRTMWEARMDRLSRLADHMERTRS